MFQNISLLWSGSQNHSQTFSSGYWGLRTMKPYPPKNLIDKRTYLLINYLGHELLKMHLGYYLPGAGYLENQFVHYLQQLKL